jgi:hypothetical protein
MVLDAMLDAQKQGGLIAVETDAVFSTVPLDLPIGEGLGEWECTTFDEMIYLQSGMYFGRQGTDWTEKYGEVPWL